jgi:hypothetical protein
MVMHCNSTLYSHLNIVIRAEDTAEFSLIDIIRCAAYSSHLQKAGSQLVRVLLDILIRGPFSVDPALVQFHR